MTEQRRNGISILKADTLAKAYEDHVNHPILMMTSQRFQMMETEELQHYMSWKGGKRNTIIFDEKPELYFQYDIDFDTIHWFEAEFFGIVSKCDLKTRKTLTNYWLTYRNSIAAELLLSATEDPQKMNHFVLRGKETPEETGSRIKPEESAQLLFDGKIDLPTFMSFIESKSKDLFKYNKHSKHKVFIKALELLEHHIQLYSYRSMDTRKYHSSFNIIKSEVDKLRSTEANIIILDATADLSMDYKQDGIFVDTENCRQHVRRFPQLTLYLVECNTAKHSFTIKGKSLLPLFIQYMEKETKSKSICCFSYKDIIEMNESDKTEDANGRIHNDRYFGNLKGRNDLQDHDVLGQVGINECPESYYLSRYLDQHHEIRKCAYEATASSVILDSVIVSQDYLRFKDLDLLADIEQNIFRSRIRTPGNKEEVKYFIFYNFDSHSNLKNIIIDRFRGQYAAKVIEGMDATYLLDVGKTMTRKSSKGNQTYAQKIWDESEKIPVGQEFRMAEWLKSINITQQQYYSAKQANKTIRNRFDSWQIDKHKGIYRKQ